MKKTFICDENSNLFCGPIILTPEIFFDNRGYFLEAWNKNNFASSIEPSVEFVQDNESFSRRGTIRGLHFQLNPYPQGKLVRVIKGEIYDVIVDLRKESKTFSKWAGIKLNSEQKNQLWIPHGFAHGFLTISEEAIVGYKVTNFWVKDLERTLCWNDKEINVNWPFKEHNNMPELSAKDNEGYSLKKLFDRGELF